MPTTDIGSRIERLRTRTLSSIKISEQKFVDGKAFDEQGSETNLLHQDFRFIGVADYILDHNINSFRKNFAKSAQLFHNLQLRESWGHPIDWSYLTMICARSVFDALASGDKELSEAIAIRMGDRGPYEGKGDRPFDLALGYAVKYLILGKDDLARHYIPHLEEACLNRDCRYFAGYPFVLQCIIDGDEYGLVAAFAELLEGHRAETEDDDGLFHGNEDELLCVWGLGLTNLARWRGLDIDPNDVMIPTELLVSVLLR